MLKEDMSGAPWHILEIFDDVDDCQYAWHLLYKDIMQQHVKTRRVKIRSKSLPWIDTKIRKEMSKRYKYLKAAQTLPKDHEKWVLYKEQRNKVNNLVRKSEAEYWRQSFGKAMALKNSGKW